MKRTKLINHATFRKSWQARHLTPVALAASAIFALSGCEQSDQTVSMYQNADDCSRANPGQHGQCTTAYNNALKEAEKTAPKYATREDCVAEFGENRCQQSSSASAGGGSVWMPLMAGYMMGRLLSGGFSQQPLFSSSSAASPARSQYVDASGRSYGTATPGRTTTVPASAMAPKPATTTTITRGGFGETIARQATMQRSQAGNSGRSLGG